MLVVIQELRKSVQQKGTSSDHRGKRKSTSTTNLTLVTAAVYRSDNRFRVMSSWNKISLFSFSKSRLARSCFFSFLGFLSVSSFLPSSSALKFSLLWDFLVVTIATSRDSGPICESALWLSAASRSLCAISFLSMREEAKQYFSKHRFHTFLTPPVRSVLKVKRQKSRQIE